MKKLTLVTAAISNEIYLTSILKDGTMNYQRKVVTKEAIGAVAEHLISVQRSGDGIGYTIHVKEGDGLLTFIPPDKIEQVRAILKS